MQGKCWICGRTKDEVDSTNYYSILEEQFMKPGGEVKPSQLFFKHFHPVEDPNITICAICHEILKKISDDLMDHHKINFHSKITY